MANHDLIIESLKGILEGTNVQLYNERIDQYSKQLGFGLLLAQISVSSQNYSLDIRQLSSIILKKFIKENWEDDKVIGEEEKLKIRELLSPSLSDPSSKIRTAIAMCIGRIGAFEWPNKWPSLVDDLVKCLSSQSTTDNLFNGALKCLEILFDTDYLDSDQILTYIRKVFPIFHQILFKQDIDPMVHVKILGIFKTIISFVTLVGAYDKEFNRVFLKVIPTWIDIFVIYLSKSVPESNKFINELFTIQTLQLEILATLYGDDKFNKIMVKYVPKLLPPVWSLYNASFIYYERSEISMDGSIPVLVEDGVTRIDSLISSLFEFLISIIDIKNKNHKATIHNSLHAILYNAILYLQMSNELVESYESDTSQYLENESDTKYIPRVMAIQLIFRVLDTYRIDGLKSLFSAVSAHISKAEDRQNVNWWRYREAALQVLTETSEYFIKAAKKEKVLDFSLLLREVLPKDILAQGDDIHLWILRGRALRCASKYSKYVDGNLTLPFLTHSIEILLHKTIPLSLKIQAIQAIGGFCPNIEKEIFKTYIPSILKGIVDILPEITEETLTFVLDTLLVIVKIDQDITGSYEYILTPQLLRTWTAFAKDDLITQDIKEVFQVICLCPKSYPGILQRLFETLNIILESFGKTDVYQGIIESAIDILGVVMANYKDRYEVIILDKLFAPLVTILMTVVEKESNSSIIKASLCALLPFIYRIPPQELLNWKHPVLGIQGIQNLYVVIQKYFQYPDELISMYVPPLITGVILKYQEHITNDLKDILGMVLKAFYTARIPSLKQSLIAIFARLIYQYSESVIEFMNATPVPGNPNQSAFTFLLNEWCKYHEDIQTKLDTNLSVLCLIKLLSLNDPKLMTLIVDDQLQNNGAIRSNPNKVEVWSKAPFLVKTVKLLLTTYDLENLDAAELKKFQQEKYASRYQEEEEEEEEEDDSLHDEDEEIGEDDGFDDAENYDLDGDEDDYDWDGGFDEYDPISKEDPIYHVNIANQIKEFLLNIQKILSPQAFEIVIPTLNQYKVDQYFSIKKQ